MEYIKEYLKDVIKVKPLGKLTTKEDELDGMSGEMVYIDGKCSDIFITHADYANWLEKRGQKPKKVSIWKHWKDGIAGNGDGKPIFLVKIGNRYNLSSCLSTECDYIELSELDNLALERQYEQKSFNYENINIQQKDFAPKVEPKFHEGDWIVWRNQCYNVNYTGCGYELIDQNGLSTSLIYTTIDENAHLFSLQDAKDGDVLAFYSEYRGKKMVQVGIIEVYVGKHGGCSNTFKIYVGVNWENNLQIGKYMGCSDIRPATKEQRDLLFKKMKEAGYKWENNQLEEINGNEDFVDLNLPSGTLWAKCNLGAEKETDFGKFFQWGDTQGYSGVDDDEHWFDWNDYKFGCNESLTKYNVLDNNLILDKEDDPVFAATCGKMMTPTKEQLQELIDFTNHEWTTIDGVNGMKFWKKDTEEPTDSESYIFIPAAGVCLHGRRDDVGSWGSVWSASCYESFVNLAWYMVFNAGDVYMDFGGRCFGFSVRGVVVPQAKTFDEIDDTDDGQPVDLGLPSGTKWMKSNIGATKPSDFGKFFQWSDTKGHKGVGEHHFSWIDYKWGNSLSQTKYNNTDGLTLLESSDDSAVAATGGQASMPTKTQLEELFNNTEHRWLSLANGINGMKFWKKGTEEPTDGRSYIFIPAAGDCYAGSHDGVGSAGCVWSTSRNESLVSDAWYMYFDADFVHMYYTRRCNGFSVRGVVAPQTETFDEIGDTID